MWQQITTSQESEAYVRGLTPRSATITKLHSFFLKQVNPTTLSSHLFPWPQLLASHNNEVLLIVAFITTWEFYIYDD